MPNPVIHQPEHHRFVIIEDGAQALLEYRMLAPDVIDFVHTWTPAALRGRGLAAQLVEAGVGHAREQGWRVIGSCSYVAAWLEKHAG
ncbi:MAG TPA: GNAT family N-acetyltransferase [Xanthomonadales bacterium]|nr:GNAT family N-acetyltransferase [Xanthomonadales bacterium]